MVVTQQKHQEAGLVLPVWPGEETRMEVVTIGQEATVTATVVVAKEQGKAN